MKRELYKTEMEMTKAGPTQITCYYGDVSRENTTDTANLKIAARTVRSCTNMWIFSPHPTFVHFA
jgi:hypothetical protein